MKDYLSTLLLVSAITALLSALPSEGGAKRAVSFALSLAVLSAVVLPLPALLSGSREGLSEILDSLSGEAEEGSDWLEAETLLATAEGLKSYLCEEFGLRPAEVAVAVEGDLIDNTVILRRVTLSLTGRAAAADVPRLVRTVEAETGADCEVIYPEER